MKLLQKKGSSMAAMSGLLLLAVTTFNSQAATLVTRGTGLVGDGVEGQVILDDGFSLYWVIDGGQVHNPSNGGVLWFQAGSEQSFPGGLVSDLFFFYTYGERYFLEGAVDGDDNWMKVIRDGDGAVSWAQFAFVDGGDGGGGLLFDEVRLFVTRTDGSDFSLAEAVEAVKNAPNVATVQPIQVKLVETYTAPGLKDGGSGSETTKESKNGDEIKTDLFVSKQRKSKIDNNVILQGLLNAGVIDDDSTVGWSINLVTNGFGEKLVCAINGDTVYDLSEYIVFSFGDSEDVGAFSIKEKIVTKNFADTDKEDTVAISYSEKLKTTVEVDINYVVDFDGISLDGVANRFTKYDKRSDRELITSTKITALTGASENSNNFDQLEPYVPIVEGTIMIGKQIVDDGLTEILSLP